MNTKTKEMVAQRLAEQLASIEKEENTKENQVNHKANGKEEQQTLFDLPVIQIDKKRESFSNVQLMQLEISNQVHARLETAVFSLEKADVDRGCFYGDYEGKRCRFVLGRYTDLSDGIEEKSDYSVLFRFPDKILRFDGDEENVIYCTTIGIVALKYAPFIDACHNLEEKIDLLKNFNALSVSQRQHVYHITRGEGDEPAVKSSFQPIRSKEGLCAAYAICKPYLPKAQNETLAQLFELLKSTSSEDKQADVLTRISYAFGINTIRTKQSKMRKFDEIVSIFRKYVYGMDELVESVAECILAQQYAGSLGISILLVGNPGVGKTSIGKAVAEVFERPFAQVDCVGKDFISINGLVSSYSGAKTGRIADAFFETGTNESVIMLDELDKITSTKDDGFPAFTKLLGPEHMLHDDFLDFDIDVSPAVFIATANDIEKIPDYILNRFGNNIFYMPDYTAEDKAMIAKKYLLAQIMETFHIFSDEVEITDEALLEIAKNYCSDFGAREMSGNLELLMRKVIRAWSEGAKKPFKIDKEFVKQNLKTKPSAQLLHSSKRGMGFLAHMDV